MKIPVNPPDAPSLHSRPTAVDRRRVGKGGDASAPSTKPSYVEELEQKVAKMEVSFQ